MEGHDLGKSSATQTTQLPKVSVCISAACVQILLHLAQMFFTVAHWRNKSEAHILALLFAWSNIFQTFFKKITNFLKNIFLIYIMQPGDDCNCPEWSACKASHDWQSQWSSAAASCVCSELHVGVFCYYTSIFWFLDEDFLSVFRYFVLCLILSTTTGISCLRFYLERQSRTWAKFQIKKHKMEPLNYQSAL